MKSYLQNRWRRAGVKLLGGAVGGVLLGWLCGCSGEPSLRRGPDLYLKGVKEKVSTSVTDADRSKSATEAIDRAEEELEGFIGAVETQRNRLLLVSENYDATREDIEEVFARTRDLRSKTSQHLLDQLFRMKSAMTPEEWVEVFAE